MDQHDGITSLEALYEHLNRYIKWLSYRNANASNVLLQADEIEGELLYEMVKGWVYYQHRGLNNDELLKVIKRMLANRIGELKYRFYHTHRHVELGMVDLDDLAELVADSGDSISSVTESKERVHAYFECLTPFEREIAVQLVQPDARVGQQLELMGHRKSFVHRQPTVTINPYVLARALHYGVEAIKTGWDSAERKWRSMYRTTEGIWSMATAMIRKIAKSNGKQTLLDVLDELEISNVDSATHIYDLVKIIKDDIHNNGVPEPDDVSDELFYIMVDLGYIDEDGNVLADEPDVDEQEGGVEEQKVS